MAFPSPRALFAAVAACAIAWSATAMADPAVRLDHLAYDRARHSVIFDITGPVTISTRSLKSPPRLVVDIPTAMLVSHNESLSVGDDLVKRVRVSQFEIFPPVVRVVIETSGHIEPMIAVQQTQDKLYITVAKDHAPLVTPIAAPSATPVKPVVQPRHPSPRPSRVAPLLKLPTPPAPSRTPSAEPSVLPAPPTAPPSHGPGESDLETFPQ